MKGVILDRDGTLIDLVRDEETGTITTAFHPSQIKLLPGVVEGLTVLRDAGYVLAIATNQPGPAKGHFSINAVAETNAALVAALARYDLQIAKIAVCMHHPEGGPGGVEELVRSCDCRKPKPGLLLEIIEQLGLDRALSWMIGDAPADVAAARAAGLQAGLLFDPQRCELCPLRSGPSPTPDKSAPRLHALALEIVGP